MLLGIFSKRDSVTLSVFVILVSSVLWTSQACAQVAGATLTGTVTDSSGSAIQTRKFPSPMWPPALRVPLRGCGPTYFNHDHGKGDSICVEGRLVTLKLV